jgi:two-component system, OmpR family, phosphate regulon response regulator PhoB
MGKKKILIVDDEMDMRIFLSALMETSGYKAFATRNGKDGILKARDIVPDLIILDVMMPGEGGVLMYRQLKTDKTLKDIPVIMLSAVEKKTFIHYLKMLNIQLDNSIPYPDAYMEKPPEADELLKLTGKLIQQKEIQFLSSQTAR